MEIFSGVDLVEINRVRDAIARHGERFLRRVFTETELSDCAGRVESLAARFAAKEAASKALRCGIGVVRWVDIEIRSDENKAPRLLFYGEAQRLSKELGWTTWSLSLSHTESHALAFVAAAV
ncbi:MAG: holo-ACP synthase [Anaerolineales bacterium]